MVTFIKKVNITGSGQIYISIPKDVKNVLGVKSGDFVNVDINIYKQNSDKKE